MHKPRIQLFDFLILFLSLFALFAAIGLAMLYVNNENPQDVPFILRKDTYDKVFPFLLGTVAVGGLALAYKRAQLSREKRISHQRIIKQQVEQRIKRLQQIYETALVFFHRVKLQRRRLRGAFIGTERNGIWKMRRGLYEDVLLVLNQAQLDGEQILKTLDFEKNTLAGGETPTEEEARRLEKLRCDIKSQIGGIQGILRNVTKTAEWRSVMAGTTNDEDLIEVPEGVVQFSDPQTKGNLGFRKIGEHFDSFSESIITRIRELESEATSYDQGLI